MEQNMEKINPDNLDSEDQGEIRQLDSNQLTFVAGGYWGSGLIRVPK